jgi:hypothetical protein
MPLNSVQGTIGFINTNVDANKGINVEFIDGIKKTIQSGEKVKFSVPNGADQLKTIRDQSANTAHNNVQALQPVLHVTLGNALALNGLTQRVFNITFGADIDSRKRLFMSDG